MAESKLESKARRRLVAMKDSDRQEVRREVELLVKAAFDKVSAPSHESTTASGTSAQTRGRHYLGKTRRRRMSSFDGSQSSFFSTERAVQRGFKRGLFERNENKYENDASLSEKLTGDSDHRSVGSRSKASRRAVFFQKRRKSSKLELLQEAWMCGACGKSFSSFDAAKRHEQCHIQEIVTDLGWNFSAGTGSLNQPPVSEIGSARLPHLEVELGLDAMHTPLRSNRSANNHRSGSKNSLSLPRPDVLHMSPANHQRVTEQRFYNEPRSPEQERRVRSERGLLIPQRMTKQVVLADEALIDVCKKAENAMLTGQEKDAKRALEWLSKDKDYYDMLLKRSLERKHGNFSQFKTEGKSVLGKVQNKFVDAYQLVKDGQRKDLGSKTLDHYNRRKGDEETKSIHHTKDTLYVNVIVKNSLKVVRHELDRLAKQRWDEKQEKDLKQGDEKTQRFARFRAVAQGNLVKLAGIALMSDFTPRRIAIQLSNDFYRSLTPRLKTRGVSIEIEIEYRVGGFFVLAVNVQAVNWGTLVEFANKDFTERRRRWKEKGLESEEHVKDESQRGVLMSFVMNCVRLTHLTKMETMAQLLAWCYNLHWVLYTPVLFTLYHVFLGNLFRLYFLSSVTDEIFKYVEKKGMVMQVGIRDSSGQAAFMLNALREIRADGRELKKKQEKGKGGETHVLGPLLGPRSKEDKEPAPPVPDHFEVPENLEVVGLDIELSVGFRRLRWAILSSKSQFISEAVFKTEAKYENIEGCGWSKHDEHIGLPKLPDGVDEQDFIGAEKEMSYLMPKSVFVKANTCYETHFIESYNDYCFVLKKKALTPEVPYGTTFIAWTKYVVLNTGNDSCRLICSVEAEFPNGPPMVSRQIKSGMRAGVGELFVQTGETITKYADQFP